MLKREKLKVLKNMLAYYEDLSEVGSINNVTIFGMNGMCHKFYEQVNFKGDIKEDIPEIVKYCPRRKSMGAYWWSRYHKIGLTKRINALKNTIEDVKSNRTSKS